MSKLGDAVRWIQHHIVDMQIRHKILSAFLVLVLVPLCLVSLLSYQKSKSVLEKNSEAYLTDIMNEVSKSIDLDMRSIRQLYYTIFTHDLVQTSLRLSRKGKLDELERITNSNMIFAFLSETLMGRDEIASIYIYSTYTRKTIVNFPILEELSNSQFMSAAQETLVDAGQGSPVWLGVVQNDRIVACGRAINDLQSLQMVGFFVINLRESALFDVFDRIDLSKSAEFYIINQEGRIISARDKKSLGYKSSHDYMTQVLQSGANGFFTANVDNKSLYIAYATIEQTGWKIVCAIPSSQYEREIISMRNWILMITLIALLITIILALILANSISKPVHNLTQAMKMVSAGDFSVNIDYQSRDEVGILSETFNKMVERTNMLIYKVYEEELLMQQAELKHLKLQINPHFLYNSLDTINWAARAKGLPEVGKLAKALGDLMRNAISNEEFVTLEKEIQNVNNYLYIQKYRYGDRLSVETKISEEASQTMIPKLILQPIVENAVIHGIELKIGPSRIEIRGETTEDILILSVTDNGVGMQADKLEQIRKALSESDSNKSSSVGLMNVHRRIQLYYGMDYGINLQSEVGAGTSVDIKMPLLRSDSATP